MPDKYFNNLHLTLLFPFTWDGKDFDKKLTANTHWKRVPQSNTNDVPNSTDARAKILEFNERQYYHYPAVRDALYDDGGKQSTIREYSYRDGQIGAYIINKDRNEYKLTLDSIRLKLYQGTGKVGVLIYKLRYPNQDVDPETVIRICEYSRRVYLSYMNEEGIGPFQNADILTIQYGDKIIEDFKIPLDYVNNVDYLSKTIMGLFGDLFTYKKDKREEEITITPVIDDRMFVALLYKNKDLVNQLQGGDKDDLTFNDVFKENLASGDKQPLDTWYQLMFIDVGNPTLRDPKLRLNIIRESTYTRWIGWGTLYGFTNYSYVTLSTEDMPGFLIDHYDTMYMQMIILTLAQRAHLIHYSNRLAELSKKLIIKKKNRAECRKITDLQTEYIHFLSQIYHEEATAQDQGIDMYARLQKALFIPEYVKAVEKQLDKLNGLAQERIDQRTENMLGVVAIASLLGGGLQVMSAAGWFNCIWATASGGGITLFGVGLLLYLFFHNKRKGGK